jgi:hypothetical protein
MLRKTLLTTASFAGMFAVLALAAPRPAAMTATVTPAEATAGQIGTWRVRVTVGPDGVAQGGGVKVQLPDKWHFRGRNSAKGVHTTDPAHKNYVSAHCSRDGVELDFQIEGGSTDEYAKNARTSITGVRSRYAYVARATLARGRLQSGDWIEFVYGDTTGGSPGFVASPFVAKDEEVHVAVDATGSGNWRLLDNPATITTRSAPPVELRLTAPSNAVVGQPLRLHVSLLDPAQNPALGLPQKLTLFVNRGKADAPDALELGEDSPGWARVDVTPRAAGILRVGARTADGMLWALSNPVRVTDEAATAKVYWGDLHSHTKVSWDGMGNNDASYRYARDVSALDFYARTDHAGDNLGEPDWQDTKRLTRKFYEPGHFATIYGYECSFGAPYAHHNVFFRGLEGRLFAPPGRPRNIPGEPPRVDLNGLWDALRDGDAITIPHHTGCFSLPDWSRFRDDQMRPLIEIYSIHGTGEYFDPGHPLAYDQSDGRLHQIDGTRGAKDGPYFAQDLWNTGQLVGTIASSDDHRSQPGRPQMGLAAVFAPELTREAVFDALRSRRAYGTTGERILLDFSVNGTSMGGEAKTEGPPKLTVWAYGTDQISLFEVLRHNAASIPPLGKGGMGGWQVIHRLRPNTEEVSFTLEDPDFTAPAVYYVRLRQANTVRNRVVMAWSSPVWVRR